MISSKQEVLATFGQEYFIIPKTCKAGVVLNEGPDFTVGIDNVAVPEPGTIWRPQASSVTRVF